MNKVQQSCLYFKSKSFISPGLLLVNLVNSRLPEIMGRGGHFFFELSKMVYNNLMFTYFIKNLQLNFFIQKCLKNTKNKNKTKLHLGALDA